VHYMPAIKLMSSDEHLYIEGSLGSFTSGGNLMITE
jgi:hypothetical protein